MPTLKRNEWIAVGVTLAVLLFFFLSIGLKGFPLTQQAGSLVSPGAVDLSVGVQNLVVEDSVVGTGKEVNVGSLLTIHYVGALPDGTIFDSSRARGEPFSFTLGSGQVIAGFDQGFVGMKEGGTRILIIPAHLGYGSQGVGSIPPNSTLIFQVELISVGEAN